MSTLEYMSAITYPAGHHHRTPAAPFGPGLRRLLGRRPRRWDDRPGIERNASPSELAMRTVSPVPGIHP